ncbi:MAG: long-chain-fatty-acid--CoA ligase [Planctomycetes bacterium]|nr:long-chain-fatty-acid--CoA ligase [Planctomycetota bacterium]
MSAIWQILERAERLHPDRAATLEGRDAADYRRFGARIRRMAAFLRSRGVGPGERVAILEWNTAAFLEAYFAAAGLGAILVPLNVRLAPPEQARVLAHCGARWLLASSGFADTIGRALEESETTATLRGILWLDARPQEPVSRGLGLEEHAYAALRDAGEPAFEPARVSASDVAHLYYTSGTTGRPKGVMLTHGNVTTHALAAVAELRIDSTDTWGHFAPLFHLADAWATFAFTWVGARHVLLPRFEPADALRTISAERVTITNLVPAMLNLMVRHPRLGEYDLSSMRAILSGGAPIAPQVVRAVSAAFGCEYVQTYGMTETSPFLTLSLLSPKLRALPPDEQLAWRAKTGRPFLTVELEVRAEDGSLVSPDGATAGEICVRGPTVMPGYWNDAEATRAAFDARGFLRTGDLAVLDAEGYVNIVDRKKDMIISGGEKVYSTEIEHVLYRHAAVLEAAVYGLPDEKWGERVCAAVVLRSGASAGAAELEAHCRTELAGFKVPREFRFLDALPRTGSGKITKQPLRERDGRGRT